MTDSWIHQPAAAFDLETTGTDVFSDFVVTGCLASIDSSNVHCRRWIADPGIEIPAEATEVHGISTDYARKHGKPHAEVVDDIVTQLDACFGEGRYIATYNGCFDLSLIATHATGFAVRGLVIDCRVIDKQFDKWRKGRRKLVDVCAHYGVRLDDAHDAEGDAIAAARLAWKLPRVYPELARYTAAELMDAQAHWYREQAYSFIDYLRRQGKPFTDVQTTWPLYSPKAEAA